MTKMLMVGVALVALVGCSSTPKAPPPDLNNITVTVASGKSLRDAIITSATRRRWITSTVSEDVVRCTILQRSNKVEIDIVIHDKTTYSIRYVSSNIPQKKYAQWVDNLRREIAKAAM